MSDDFLRSCGWTQHVDFFASGGHEVLLQEVAALRTAGKTIYPPQQDILQAFAHTSWEQVRVLILGQDPYHGKGQAHGLAFSVPEGTKIPPSLRNILKEVARDTSVGLHCGARAVAEPLKAAHVKHAALSAPAVPMAAMASASPCLVRWAQQGVLLLNTVLSVEEGKAHSHAHLGWQALAAAVVEALAARPEPVAALLWGNAAREYEDVFAEGVAAGRHLVLCAAHPSPLSASRGFHGCGHFSAVNAWLGGQGLQEIDW